MGIKTKAAAGLGKEGDESKKPGRLTLSSFYTTRLNPVLQWLLLDVGESMMPARPLQMRHIINLQKGMTGIVMAALMVYYQNFSFAATAYTALHGSYGLVWILKDAICRDKFWDRRTTVPSSIMLALGLAIYWAPGYYIIAKGRQVSEIRAGIAIFMHTIGLVLMICADTQKYFVLQHKKGLISDGWLSLSRNTNYLGEMMIYATYAILAQAWLPWLYNVYIWGFVFMTNMMMKEVSLKSKVGGKEYVERSWLLFPNVISWMTRKPMEKVH